MTIMATTGLSLLGLDFALLLGTIMGVFEIVPLVGPMLGALPTLVVTLAASPSDLLAVLLLIVAAHVIVHHFIRPRLASDEVKVHPALVMLAIVVGSELAGLWGVLLSVPLTAIGRDLTRYLALRVSEDPLEPEEALARVLTRSRSA